MSENFQPFQSSAPQLGMLVQWNDEKGFGWIESGRKRFFVHIKDFDRGRWRPKIGEELRFILGIDPKGRDCAKRVTFVKSSGDNEIVRSRVGVGSWVLLVLLLVLPLCALLWIPMPWWLCVGGMLVASAITYRMYGHDKQQAIAGGWRVPENWLHFAELAVGWPGHFWLSGGYVTNVLNQAISQFSGHSRIAPSKITPRRGYEKSAVAGRCAGKNDTQMQTRSEIMSHTSKEEYLVSCRERYPSRNRAGRSAMTDEASDTLG